MQVAWDHLPGSSAYTILTEATFLVVQYHGTSLSTLLGSCLLVGSHTLHVHIRM